MTLSKDYFQDNNNIKLNKGDKYKVILDRGYYYVTDYNGKVIISTNKHIIDTFFKVD